MPMWPDCGTQNMVCRSVEPQNFNGSRGPGTLVITAVVFLANRPVTRSCAGFTSSPDAARMRNASSGW